MTARWLGILLLLSLPCGVAEGQARAALEPLFGASRDSDGNLGLRAGLRVSAPVAEAVTLGIDGWRWQVEDRVGRVRLYHAALSATVRPTTSLLVEGDFGGTLVDLSDSFASDELLPTGRFRFRWRGPSGSLLDVRARRDAVEASPALIANRVTRSEASATVDLPVVSPLKLRGIGRAARLTDRLGSNTRLAAAGMLVLAVQSVEVSAQVHSISYDHSSPAGYFAPRLIQSTQLGSYGEFEGESVMLAYDVSAGFQRMAEQGSPLGGWGPTASLWGQLGLLVTARTQLRLELELYASPAPAFAASGPGWKYGAATLSLRKEL